MPHEAHAPSERFNEDLPQLAAEAFALAEQRCGACKNFHMLWPYHRLAEASGGDVAAPLVRSALARLLAHSGTTILIAGCADTGLLALVARIASSGTYITVLDRCDTPLELCRRFAARWSLPIRVLHLDLMDLAEERSFDVVFVHMTLFFIPADRQRDVLSRMRRSLKPDGRLVLVFRTSPRIDGDLAPEYRRNYPMHLIEQLEGRKIPLPEPREAFHNRAERYYEERREREGANATRAEVERLMHDAGFVIEEIARIDAIMSEPFRQFCERIGLQRFLAVARPKLPG